MSRAILLLFLLVAVVRAQPSPTKWRMRSSTTAIPSRVLPLSLEPPDGAAAVDARTAPQYAMLTLGSRTMFLAVSRRRLWLDRNGDGRFASSEWVSAWSITGGSRFRTSISLDIGPGGSRQQVPLQFAYRGTGASDQPLMSHGLERYGDVELLGRVRRFVLRDGNFDLRFDNPRLDLLYLDVDGDGRLQSHEGSHERARIWDGIRIGEAGFQCRPLGSNARTVQFSRDDSLPPAGPRRLPGPLLAPSGVTAPGGGNTEADRLLETFDARDVIGQLGATGGRSAFAALSALARDKTQPVEVRTRAIAALGYAPYARHSPFFEQLAVPGNEQAIRLAAIAALHASGAKGRTTFYSTFLRDGETLDVFTAAANLVGGLRPKMIAAALPRLKDPARRRIAYDAGRAALKTRLLLKLARARGEPLRPKALRDLFLLGHEDAVDLAVAAVLEPNPSADLIYAATLTLGPSGSPEAIAVLFDLVQHGFEVPKLDALLAADRRERSITAIAARLGSKSDRVRLIAIRVLGKIPSPIASEALVEHVGKEQKNAWVRALDIALLAHAHPRTLARLQRPIRRARDIAAMQSEILKLVERGQRFVAVRQTLIKLLGRRNWESRVLILRALRSGPYSDLARAAANCLRDRSWQVRLSAAEALGRFRVSDGFEAMVTQLEKEKQLRVKAALGESLTTLTGEKLGRYGGLWRKWWDREGGGFVVPVRAPKRARPKGKARGETKTVANFYGIPVTSNRVIFVLDRSGSMNTPMHTDRRTRLDHAKRQLEMAVAAMPSSTRINVVFFGSGAARWRSRLIALSKSSRSALHTFLGGIDSRGGTEMYDALALALKDKEVTTIYLLSDGSPTGKFSRQSEMIRAVARLNLVRRVRIHCISLGRSSPMMKLMAKQNDGSYRRE